MLTESLLSNIRLQSLFFYFCEFFPHINCFPEICFAFFRLRYIFQKVIFSSTEKKLDLWNAIYVQINIKIVKNHGELQSTLELNEQF